MANEPSWIEARSGPEAELLELAEDLRKAPDFVGIGPRGLVLNKEA